MPVCTSSPSGSRTARQRSPACAAPGWRSRASPRWSGRSTMATHPGPWPGSSAFPCPTHRREPFSSSSISPATQSGSLASPPTPTLRSDWRGGAGSARPSRTAARISLLSGVPVVPDPVGGFALPLGRGRVRMVPPEALPAIYPGVVPPVSPCIAGMTIATADRCASLRPLLDGLSHQAVGQATLVLPVSAGGAAVLFN